jgi:hypothetical protein
MHGIICAGAKTKGALRERGVERVPLLTVNGETILARTCRSLREGAGCEHVCVLAPEEVPLPDDGAAYRGQYSGALVADVLHYVRQKTTGEHIVLAGGDMPLITPQAFAALRAAGTFSQADLVYPIVLREEIEATFPGTQRTYLRLGKKQYSGGNAFWLRREWLLAKADLITELFARRKSILKLAQLFGLGFFLRIALGAATKEYLEQHLGAVVHAKLVAAVLPYPELAVDLDKAADLDTFASYLDPFDDQRGTSAA